MEDAKVVHPPAPKPAARAAMLGWFAAVIVGVVAAVLAQSDAVPENCPGWCFSDRDKAIFAVVVIGLPSLFVAGLVGLIVLRWLGGRGRTGVVAGSAAAITGLVMGPVVVVTTLAGYLAVRRS